MKGGWAGRWGEGSPGELGTIAGEARYRYHTVGSAYPKGGGAGTAGAADMRAERVVSSAGLTSFLRDPRPRDAGNQGPTSVGVCGLRQRHHLVRFFVNPPPSPTTTST